MEDLLSLFVRASLLYIYTLVQVRWSGKRGLGNLTAADFVMILVVGDQFDNIFYADGPFIHGLVGLSTILILHGLVSYLAYRWRWFDDIVLGNSKHLIIRKGEPVAHTMKIERISDGDLETLLRMQGIEDIAEVKEAYLEANGNLSILKVPPAKPVLQKDINRLLELFK